MGTAAVDARDGQRYETPRGAFATQFISKIKTTQGDRMPDREVYVLPSCVDRKSVYEEYATDVLKPVCRKHFERIWKLDHSNLKTTKVHFFVLSDCNLFI